MKPTIGMPVTVIVGSDKYAHKVTGIFGNKTIEISGQSGYRRFTLRRNGKWVQTGDPLWSNRYLVLGVGEDYRDPSF